MVLPARLELATLGLEVLCSIHLSYGSKTFFGAGYRSRTGVLSLEN